MDLWRGSAASSGRPLWCQPLLSSAIRSSASCAWRDVVDGGRRRVPVAAPFPRVVAVRCPPLPRLRLGVLPLRPPARPTTCFLPVPPSPPPLAPACCLGLSPTARGWCGWRWAWRRGPERCCGAIAPYRRLTVQRVARGSSVTWTARAALTTPPPPTHWRLWDRGAGPGGRPAGSSLCMGGLGGAVRYTRGGRGGGVCRCRHSGRGGTPPSTFRELLRRG